MPHPYPQLGGLVWFFFQYCDMACTYVISLVNMHQKCIALLNYSMYMHIALAVNYLTCVNHHWSVILFKFYRDGLMRGIIKCVQLKFHGYFCSTDRMLHKSQNEVASQLFLLHFLSSKQDLWLSEQIWAPLHADIIWAVLCYHAAFR